MTTNVLTQEFVFAALEAERNGEQFPIDLDDVWQPLGYVEKRNCLDSLKSYFKEGLDFSSSGTKSPSGGRPSHRVCLSCDCYKMLGMVAKTDEGDNVRRYFVSVEKAYIANLERQLKASIEPSDETNETTARLAYFEQRLMESEAEVEEINAILVMMNSFCVHTLGFKVDDMETLYFLACYGESVTDIVVTGLANVKDAKKIQKLAKNISKLLPHFKSAVENATTSFLNLPGQGFGK